MTKPLPFTAAGVARAMRGVEAAGKFVVAVTADGTVIVGEKPIDVAGIVPAIPEDAAPSKWEGV